MLLRPLDTGNGIFFQWLQCAGIYIVGFIISIFRPAMWSPVAMVGGIAWCTGNMLCVPIIQRLGLGVGLSLWSGAGMVFGWCSSVTGLMGQKPSTDKIHNWALNITGFCLTLTAITVLVFVKPEKADDYDSLDTSVAPVSSSQADSIQVQFTSSPNPDLPVTFNNGYDTKFDAVNILDSASEASTSGSSSGSTDEFTSLKRGSRKLSTEGVVPPVVTDAVTGDEVLPAPVTVRSAHPLRARIEGVIMALIAGFCFGTNYNFVELEMNKEGASQNGLDYIFSQLTGVMFSSTIYFMTYAAYSIYYRKTLPVMNISVTPMGFVSGVMWGIAQSAWFIANDGLSAVITWPLISVGPTVVAYAWSIFYFKEIRTRRNLTLVAVFMVICIASVTFTVLSQMKAVA